VGEWYILKTTQNGQTEIHRCTLIYVDNMTGKKNKSAKVPVIWQTGRHKPANKRHKGIFRGT
jgi:hypothetical protein